MREAQLTTLPRWRERVEVANPTIKLIAQAPVWWVERDSNPRTLTRPDLQSGAINHSTTYPFYFFLGHWTKKVVKNPKTPNYHQPSLEHERVVYVLSVRLINLELRLPHEHIPSEVF